MSNPNIGTLNYEDVMAIHAVLVRDFLETDDPIQPPGVRGDGELLKSAISRQYVGLGATMKYATPLENAASLCYGICCNHAFHNGNKRTALVSLLCHLDKNGLTLKESVSRDELYDFMINIADHRFAPKKHKGDRSDVEVQEISRWLRHNTRQIKKGERVVTFRKLRQILQSFDIYLENPRGNYIDVIQYTTRRKLLIGKKERIGKRVANIPYPREGEEVGRLVLKTIREVCGLTEKDGYDSDLFYSAETEVDTFVLRYKKTLKRLAKV